MGIAVGCVGMSRESFERSTPQELEAIIGAWGRREQNHERQEWERTRLLACVVVQPFITERLTPRKLIPLPWDDQGGESTVKENLTVAERREKAKEFLERLRVSS